MWFAIDPGSSTPIYQQLVDKIKAAVARGILSPGDKIPTVRELASEIMLNPNTIAKAYQRLEQEGIIVTMRSRGTFIAEPKPAVSLEAADQILASELEKLIINAYHLGIDSKKLRLLLKQKLDKWENQRGDE